MKKLKRLLINFPEYYLIILSLLAGYTPPFTFNPVFIVFASILLLLIISGNKILGVIIAATFILINLYVSGALLSEFYEFKELNHEAIQLLSGGLLIGCLNMMSSAIMIYKYTGMRML